MAEALTRQRLAVLAPVALLHALTSALLLLLDVQQIAWVLAAGVFVVPFVMGLWLFNDRRGFSRVLLSLWGPAGELLLFGAVWLIIRLLSGAIPQGVVVVIAFGPLAALLAGGLFALKGAERGVRAPALVLWLVAIGGSVAALPLANWLAGVAGIDPIAGMVVLFAPAVALGTWLGLALATRLPEPDSRRHAAQIGVEP